MPFKFFRATIGGPRGLVAAAVLGAGLMFGLVAGPAAAQPVSLTTLHSFTSADGLEPAAVLVQGADGSFYGSTSEGGQYSLGSLFKIGADGSFTSLLNFDFYNGASPSGLVLGPDGNFYGTTVGGASGTQPGYGNIFRVTPDGTLSILFSFDYTNGAYPRAALVLGSDGSFYGTTSGGGIYVPVSQGSGYGTVFKFSLDSGFTSLHSFTGSDGNIPQAALVQGSDGKLYGTTVYGGAAGYGSVFSITPDGSFNLLHSFSGPDGSLPQNALVEGADGALYGTTYGASVAYGTVFKITTDGSLTTLHGFSGTDGYAGGPLMLASDGSFYGSTYAGGTSYVGPASGYGTLFKMAADGTFASIYSFDGVDGQFPGAALLQAADGKFYGTTELGGATASTDQSAYGTVFEMTPPLPPPAPADLVAVAGGASISLSWTASDGASIYNVYEGSSAGGESTSPVTSVFGTSVTLVDLVPGVGYYFIVRAANDIGTSPASNEASATPLYGTAATPVFQPQRDVHLLPHPVVITDTTPGAAIHYTTDGSTPTAGSALYTGPIKVSVSETIKAIAIAPDYVDSAVSSASYTVGRPGR